MNDLVLFLVLAGGLVGAFIFGMKYGVQEYKKKQRRK